MKPNGSETTTPSTPPGAANAHTRARRKSVKGRLPKDSLRAHGRPLTTAELAEMIGMSSTFIRKEIDSGYLRAIRIGRGRKPVFRIAVREAHRYLRELGLL